LRKVTVACGRPGDAALTRVRLNGRAPAADAVSMTPDQPATLRIALELVLLPVSGASRADLDQAVLCTSCDGSDAGRAAVACRIPEDDCPRRCSCGGHSGAALRGTDPVPPAVPVRRPVPDRRPATGGR